MPTATVFTPAGDTLFNGSHNRSIDRTSNNVWWTAFIDTDDEIYLRYSTNNGATWNTPATSLPTITPSGLRSVSIYIDNSDQIHVFYGIVQGACYYVMGTPNAGRTDFTYMAWQTIDNTLNSVDGAFSVASVGVSAWDDGTYTNVALIFGGGNGNTDAKTAVYGRVGYWNGSTWTLLGALRSTVALRSGSSGSQQAAVTLSCQPQIDPKESNTGNFYFVGQVGTFSLNAGVLKATYNSPGNYSFQEVSVSTTDENSAAINNYTEFTPLVWDGWRFVGAARIYAQSNWHVVNIDPDGNPARLWAFEDWTLDTVGSASITTSFDATEGNVYFYRLTSGTELQRKRLIALDQADTSWTTVETITNSSSERPKLPTYQFGAYIAAIFERSASTYDFDITRVTPTRNLNGQAFNGYVNWYQARPSSVTTPRLYPAPNPSDLIDLGGGKFIGLLTVLSSSGYWLTYSSDNGRSWEVIGTRSTSNYSQGWMAITPARDAIFVVSFAGGFMYADYWSWNGTTTATYINSSSGVTATNLTLTGRLLAYDDGTDHYLLHGAWNSSALQSSTWGWKRTGAGVWSSIDGVLAHSNVNGSARVAVIPLHDGDGVTFSSGPNAVVVTLSTTAALNFLMKDWNGTGWTSGTNSSLATGVSGNTVTGVADGAHFYVLVMQTVGANRFVRRDYGDTQTDVLALPSTPTGGMYGAYAIMGTDYSNARTQYIYLAYANTAGQIQATRYNKLSDQWESWREVDDLPSDVSLNDAFSMPLVKNSREPLVSTGVRLTSTNHYQPILYRNLWEPGPLPSSGFGWGTIPIGG